MKSDETYLKHILAAVAKIERYVAGADYETFAANDMMIDAVVRELEIIGEASRHISPAVQAEHPELPLRETRNMRNFLIHEYFGIDSKVVWDTCQFDLPPLKQTVSLILAKK